MNMQRIVKRLRLGVSIGCLLAAMAPLANAADVSFGVGAGFAPDYEGSDDYQIVPIPFANVAFDNGMFFNLTGLTAKANLIPSQAWRLGPMYNYRPSRSDVDNSQIDQLQNVSDANEVGAFAGFEIDNWFVFVEFSTDIGNAHEGWLATARGGYNWAASKSWTLSFGLSTTYASDDFMSTYFGIDAADAARSGLGVFDADEGFKDVGFDLGIICRFTDHWSGRVIGRYARLIGDADDSSPVTDEGSANQLFGGLLVVFTF